MGVYRFSTQSNQRHPSCHIPAHEYSVCIEACFEPFVCSLKTHVSIINSSFRFLSRSDFHRQLQYNFHAFRDETDAEVIEKMLVHALQDRDWILQQYTNTSELSNSKSI